MLIEPRCAPKSAKTQITENMCLICLQAFNLSCTPKHKSLTCTFACVCVHTPAGLGSVLRMDGYYAIRFWLCSSMLYCYKGRFCSRFAFLIATAIDFCQAVHACALVLSEPARADEDGWGVCVLRVYGAECIMFQGELCRQRFLLLLLQSRPQPFTSVAKQQMQLRCFFCGFVSRFWASVWEDKASQWSACRCYL